MDAPWLKGTVFLIAIWGAGCLVSADDSRYGLQHNPFRKPQLVREPSVEPTPEQSTRQQPSRLILSATLASSSHPLVNVDGEIVEVGEEFGGFRLESVGEGAAVFVRDGDRYTFDVGAKGSEKE